jgi:hypothetical protein
MADDIDSRIASYFSRAVAPEDDFLRIEHTEPDFEAIEDVAVDLGILKGRHGAAAIRVLSSSAGMLCDLRDRITNKDSTLQGHTELRLELNGLAAWHFGAENSTREPFAINQGTFTFMGEQF